MKQVTGKYATAKIFTDNVEETALQQVKGMVDHEMTEKAQVRLMPDCLSYDTEVLTDKGFKFIKDIDVNTLIASYNEELDDIVWDNPTDVIVRSLRPDEKVYEFKNESLNINLVSTENHRNAIVNNMGIKTKDLSQEIMIKDILWNANTNKKGLDISDSMLKLISWIIADGNIKITNNPASKNYRVRVGAKKERKIKILKKLIKDLSLGVSIRTTEKRGTEFTINTESSKPILKLLKYKKEFPVEWIKELSQRQIKLLIEEYVKSDGDYESYLKRGAIRLNSSDIEIMNFFSALAVMGYGSSNIVERFRNKKSNHGYPGQKDISYYISIIPKERLLKSRSGYPSRKIVKEKVQYKNEVVCLTVNTGYFVARQKGRTFITGNCHAGKGSTIGTTIQLPEDFSEWKVSPNIVGIDAGCGVMMYQLQDKNVDLERLDEVVNKVIPAGFNVHSKAQNYDYTEDLINKLTFGIKGDKADRIHSSLGTLGGGNHFIELGKDEDDNYWLSVHSGSRSLGVRVTTHHQDVAVKNLEDNQIDIKSVIEELKEQGRHSEIQSTIAKIKDSVAPLTNKEKTLATLEGEDLLSYVKDMELAQKFASKSRETMLNLIVEHMELTVVDQFDSVHNFIEHNNLSSGIVRKGATSAKEGERLVIPLNMRDGSIIARGKGNADWNNSAPHGAGRLMSRTKAKEAITLEDFKKEMEGVHSSSVTESTLDEAPGAYKPAKEILDYIKPTVDVLHVIKPVYNFKSK